MTATVDHVHFEFFDSSGFTAGTTKTKKIHLPAHGTLSETSVTASATPFDASNEDRQLKVTSIAIRSKIPNAATNDDPTVRVEVESVGPDAPFIWYLNLAIVEP
ncbi:hypothetical protein Cch01nite_11650 [Cellulomonas chitinilytica]|uniref:Uncharacterized protein n=1 Tax=Cellulomonas chitinilytica TaxID=398759 RepID=A0A919NZB4_9CELL|nr:hypothetical protein [Cellulomonas chitinilytica]GIG20441.1 hypothetical protein Cch01nite_11650 [Cellulomonas chitinilytica]